MVVGSTGSRASGNASRNRPTIAGSAASSRAVTAMSPPISCLFSMGPEAWASSVAGTTIPEKGPTPRRDSRSGGVRRASDSPSSPSRRATPSEKDSSAWWQVAQATLLDPDRRISPKRSRPSAIFAASPGSPPVAERRRADGIARAAPHRSARRRTGPPRRPGRPTSRRAGRRRGPEPRRPTEAPPRSATPSRATRRPTWPGLS